LLVSCNVVSCIGSLNLFILPSVQVSSSSAAERNWSTYDFIHNKKRNRLTEAKARDLVYVIHSNLRLLKHIEAVDYTETTVQWEEWAVKDSESEEDQDED